jgi:hypothetical protein
MLSTRCAIVRRKLMQIQPHEPKYLIVRQSDCPAPCMVRESGPCSPMQFMHAMAMVLMPNHRTRGDTKLSIALPRTLDARFICLPAPPRPPHPTSPCSSGTLHCMHTEMAAYMLHPAMPCPTLRSWQVLSALAAMVIAGTAAPNPNITLSNTLGSHMGMNIDT